MRSQRTRDIGYVRLDLLCQRQARRGHGLPAVPAKSLASQDRVSRRATARSTASGGGNEDSCCVGTALPAEVVLWLHDVPRGCTATGWRDRGDRETTSRAEGISVEDGVTLRALHGMASNHWT